ncbi:MAG: hypothetical protein ACFHW5_21710 [Verrucomicrobiota bacterium]
MSKVRLLIEAEGAVVTDRYVWSIGPDIYAAAVSLSVNASAEQSQIVHSTVEIHVGR